MKIPREDTNDDVGVDMRVVREEADEHSDRGSGRKR